MVSFLFFFFKPNINLNKKWGILSKEVFRSKNSNKKNNGHLQVDGVCRNWVLYLLRKGNKLKLMSNLFYQTNSWRLRKILWNTPRFSLFFWCLFEEHTEDATKSSQFSEAYRSIKKKNIHYYQLNQQRKRNNG